MTSPTSLLIRRISSDRPAKGLRRLGVEYIEMRLFDLNPMIDIGIAPEHQARIFSGFTQAAALLISPSMVTNIWQLCDGRSPLPMLGWGVVVTALTLVALAPLFLGLLVILPVLGHATWHLYARAAAG